ncbi:MAG: glycosyltransferase family 39 protein, partial [Bdellovibrionales bacterium]|nr:glycosyltransferase family 39 protein [Bdellovibrionales bacterium]
MNSSYVIATLKKAWSQLVGVNIVAGGMFVLGIYLFFSIFYWTINSNHVVLLMVSLVIFFSINVFWLKYGKTFASKNILYFFIIFGISVRLLWITFNQVDQTSDHAYYLWMSNKILEGEFLINPFKQSGISILYALVHRITRFNLETIASAINFIFSFLQFPLLYHLVRKTLSEAYAVFGILIYSIWFESFVYANVAFNAIALSFSSLLSLYLVVEGLRKGNLFDFVFSGMVLGLSQYLRGTSFTILTFSALAIFLIVKSKIDSFKFGIFLFLGFFIMTSPILIYNFSEFGVLSVSPAFNSGVSAFIGTNQYSRGFYIENYNEKIVAEMHEYLENQNIAISSDEKMNLKEVLKIQNLLYHPIQNRKWAPLRNQVALNMAIQNISKNPLIYLKNVLLIKLPVFLVEPSSFAWNFSKEFMSARPWLENYSIILMVIFNLFFATGL